MSHSLDLSFSSHRFGSGAEFFSVDKFFRQMGSSVPSAFSVHVPSDTGVQILSITRVETAIIAQDDVHVVRHRPFFAPLSTRFLLLFESICFSGPLRILPVMCELVFEFSRLQTSETMKSAATPALHNS